MAYKTGTAQNYRDLLRILRHFVTGRATVGAITQTGTGNGALSLIDPVIGAVSQTWTLICTAGGPTGTFSVTGSVSGAMAAATVGTAYSNAAIAFLISDGSADFVIGDQFVFAVTASTMPSGERWVQDRWDDLTVTQELLLHGPGLAGTDNIFGGFRSSENTGVPYYAWRVAGHIGYVSGNDFFSQPGHFPSGQLTPLISLLNAPMTYWLVASGRRIVLVVKAGSLFQAAYLGFALPYATPGQYPYPLFVGGCMTGEYGAQLSLATTAHRHFVDPGDSASNPPTAYSMSRLRAPDGRWASFLNRIGNESRSPQNANTFPYNWNGIDTLRESPDGGSHALMPIVLMETYSGANNLWGELDGCFHVSGYNQAAENLVNISGQDYLVVPNVFRTALGDWWALKLA